MILINEISICLRYALSIHRMTHKRKIWLRRTIQPCIHLCSICFLSLVRADVVILISIMWPCIWKRGWGVEQRMKEKRNCVLLRDSSLLQQCVCVCVCVMMIRIVIVIVWKSRLKTRQKYIYNIDALQNHTHWYEINVMKTNIQKKSPGNHY